MVLYECWLNPLRFMLSLNLVSSVSGKLLVCSFDFINLPAGGKTVLIMPEMGGRADVLFMNFVLEIFFPPTLMSSTFI